MEYQFNTFKEVSKQRKVELRDNNNEIVRIHDDLKLVEYSQITNKGLAQHYQTLCGHIQQSLISPPRWWLSYLSICNTHLSQRELKLLENAREICKVQVQMKPIDLEQVVQNEIKVTALHVKLIFFYP